MRVMPSQASWISWIISRHLSLSCRKCYFQLLSSWNRCWKKLSLQLFYNSFQVLQNNLLLLASSSLLKCLQKLLTQLRLWYSFLKIYPWQRNYRRTIFASNFFIACKENYWILHLTLRLNFCSFLAQDFALNSILTISWDYETSAAGKRVRPSQASWINWVIRLI